MSPSDSVKDAGALPSSDYDVPLVVGSLILGVFFGGVGGGVVFPTLPTLGAVLGISPLLVGVILSANRFTRLLMNTPAGQIIDRMGTRRPMMAGLLLQGLVPFGYVVGLNAAQIPVVDAATIFIAARVFWGIGSAFVFVGAFSTVTHITEQHNRGKWIGYFRSGQSLGFPSGLVLGGVLTDLYSYELAFLTAGAVGLLAAVIAGAVLPDIVPDVGPQAPLSELPSLVRSDPRLLTIGTVNLVVRFLFAGVLLSTIVLYAQAHGVAFSGLGAIGASGILLAITVLFASGATVASGSLSDWVDNRALVTVPALGVFALGFGVLGAVATLPTIMAGVSLIGVGVGGTNPPLLALLGDISPDADIGKMGGLYNVFGDTGSMLGPVVALPLAVRLGYRPIYYACALLGILTTVLIVATLLGSSRVVPADERPDESEAGGGDPD